MTKPIKKKSAKSVIPKKFRLEKQQKQEISELLLLPDEADQADMKKRELREFAKLEAKIIYQIEAYLGAYTNGFLEVINDVPRPADYKEGIGKIRVEAYQLLQKIISEKQASDTEALRKKLRENDS